MDLVKTSKQILDTVLYITEENFFLNCAVKLNLNLATTKKQLKEIHNKITSGESSLEDYSRELQKVYFDYCDFLNINYEK